MQAVYNIYHARRILSLQQCSVTYSQKYSLHFILSSEETIFGKDAGKHPRYLSLRFKQSKVRPVVERNVSGGFEGCSVISPHIGHDEVTMPRLRHFQPR